MTTGLQKLVIKDVYTLLVLLCIGGCSCEDSNIVAKLINSSGSVERDFAANLEHWQKALSGSKFTYGEGIRTLEGADALLELFDGSHMKLEPVTEIRFLATPPGAEAPARIDVMSGEAEIEVGDVDLNVQTALGLAQVEPKGRIRLRKTKDGTVFMVSIGKAVFVVDKDGVIETLEINAGEQVSVALGEAIVEAIIETSKEPPAEDPLASLDTSAREIDPEIDTDSDSVSEAEIARPNIKLTFATQPPKADFAAPAGSRFKVHSPSLPVIVELSVADQCPLEAAIKLVRGEDYLSKDQKVRFPLSAGRTRYKVHCLDERGDVLGKAATSASISVVKDAGKASLAKRTPPSFVDADGRSYKILYQNRLPKVTFTWPKAPKDSAFNLELVSRGKKKTITTHSPNHTFSSGQLKDGKHTLKFRAKNSGRFSKTTTVQISFDNATPTAKLSEPSNRSFGAGSALNIAGVAAPGWKATVAGVELEVDGHNRFAGQYVYRGAYRSIAVRLSHPRRGVHYYLRQAAGSND